MRHIIPFLLLTSLLLSPTLFGDLRAQDQRLGKQLEELHADHLHPVSHINITQQLLKAATLNKSGGTAGFEVMELTEAVCELRALEENAATSVPPPAAFQQKSLEKNSDCANIEVNYIGFEAFPEALAAFQYAVEIWESLITSPVTIKVDATFEPLGQGILGSAGPTFLVRNFPGAVPNTWYGSALGDQIAGFDLIPGEADIRARFSSTFGWYFGRDGNPPPGTFDFVTVVLHELGHGLGFFGSANAIPNPVLGVYGLSGLPTIYDAFIENGAGTPVSAIAPPGVVSPALGAFFQSNNLFNNSPAATAANGGTKPAVYAPLPFRPGSSYSHWDEATFPPGTPQSLMTPFLSFQEANHDPGAITIGMFADHGWMQAQDCAAPNPVDDTEPCQITDISFDPRVPGPVCDVNGIVGPMGSHYVFLRVDGINPLNQPVDFSEYEAKINGKVYPIFNVGYNVFEGELYFFVIVVGIESNGLPNMPVKITLEKGCVGVAPKLYDAPTCGQSLVQGEAKNGSQATFAQSATLRVYPNPSNGVFRLETGADGGGQVQVFNSIGQLAYSTWIDASTYRDLDLSHLDGGIYTVRVQGKDGAQTKRIILNR